VVGEWVVGCVFEVAGDVGSGEGVGGGSMASFGGVAGSVLEAVFLGPWLFGVREWGDFVLCLRCRLSLR
jgi:hypothetical protein